VALRWRVQIPLATMTVACTVTGLGVTVMVFLVVVCGCWLRAAVLLPTDRHMPRVVVACGLVLVRRQRGHSQ
jgi:hypothetical protein